jgi:pilus assembly protein CpaC
MTMLKSAAPRIGEKMKNLSKNSALGFTCLTMLTLAIPVWSAAIAAGEDNIIKVTRASSKVQKIKLGLDKSIVLELPQDAYDVLVANPDVADAVTRTARRIYLFGKDVGDTNIFVFGKDGEQIANLDLQVDRNTAGLEANLAKYVENSDIKVEIINSNIVLTGTVQTAQDATKAESLANIFLNGSATERRYTSKYTSSGKGSSGSSTFIISSSASGDTGKSSVVNLLQILGDDQVTLKVTVAEVSRSVMKQLGMNTFATGQTGNTGIEFGSMNLAGLGSALYGGTGKLSTALGAGTLNSYLNAMEQAGVMKTLAEPTLTAVSGEKAEFRVGGEFSVLRDVSASPANSPTPASVAKRFEQIEYGIGLEFLPVVLSPGRINLKVRTSVSEPTFEQSGQVGAMLGGAQSDSFPSIRKRLADTTVELPSGGSMMIAGLVRDDVRQVVGGYPGLKKIPVLGALFRSRDFVRNETELVIIVTPYLVRPVARNKLNRPDDNFNVASDGAGIFLGKLNRVYGTVKTDRPAGRYHGVVGYIYK